MKLWALYKSLLLKINIWKAFTVSRANIKKRSTRLELIDKFFLLDTILIHKLCTALALVVYRFAVAKNFRSNNFSWGCFGAETFRLSCLRHVRYQQLCFHTPPYTTTEKATTRKTRYVDSNSIFLRRDLLLCREQARNIYRLDMLSSFWSKLVILKSEALSKGVSEVLTRDIKRKFSLHSFQLWGIYVSVGSVANEARESRRDKKKTLLHELISILLSHLRQRNRATPEEAHFPCQRAFNFRVKNAFDGTHESTFPHYSEYRMSVCSTTKFPPTFQLRTF